MADFDNTQAKQEGWKLRFVFSDGSYEVIKDNAAGIFWSDADAKKFVAQRANEGSEYHEQALSIVEAGGHEWPRWKDGGLI